MNFNDYQNNIPYPDAKNFSIKYWYKGGLCIAKQVAGEQLVYADGYKAEDLFNAVMEKVARDADFRAAKLAYTTETARLKEKFKADLFADLGISDNPKAELLFTKAWEMGHSNGLNEVYAHAADLVDLIV